MRKYFCVFLFLCCLCTGFSLQAREKEEEAFFVAEKAYTDGFYEASATLFDKFIRDFPQSEQRYRARLYIAQSFFSRKKFPEALAVLKELETDEGARPWSAQVAYWLGQVYFEGKSFEQALSYALKTVEEKKEDSTYWWAYYLAGECYLKLSRLDQCMQTFRDILEKSADRELLPKALLRLLGVYYSREDFSEMITLADTYFAKIEGKDEKARLLLYKGEGYFGRNDTEKALKTFKEGLALAEEQDIRDMFFQRIGDCLLAKGDEIQAKESFDSIAAEEIRQFSYANYYFRLRQYAKVLEIADEYSARFPASRYATHMMLNRADSLYEMGRIKDALFFYKDILGTPAAGEHRNIMDKAHYGLAWCYLKVGEFKKAIDEFKKTLKFTENQVVRISSQIQIADAYQEKDMFDLALETYNRVLEQYPGNIYADYIQFQIGMLFLKNDRLDEARMSFRNLEKNFPSSKLVPEAEYYLAASYFSEEDYLGAEDILEAFLEKFPRHALREKVLYLYAKCFFNRGEYERSLEILDELISQSKDGDFQQLVYIDKAYAFLNLEKYSRAREVFEEFTRKFPRSKYISSVFLKLGALCEREENYSGAEEYYTRIIDEEGQQPFYYEALSALAHIYWKQDRLDDALKYFERLSGSSNRKVAERAELYRAEIIAQEGRATEAREILDRVAASGSTLSGLASARKGFLLKDERDYAGAAEAFRASVSKGIDDVSVYFALGQCLEKLGRDTDAIDQYFKIVYLFDDIPSKVKAFFRAARVYEKQNNFEEAASIYRKIIAFEVDESKIAGERLAEIEKMKEKTK